MHEFSHIPDLDELKALNPVLRACLFDMDGTLFDTEKLHAKAIFELTDRINPGIYSFEEIEKFCIGKTDTGIFNELKDRKLFESADVPTLVDMKVNSYLKCLETELVEKIFLPKVLELLQTLKANNIKLALVTSSDYKSTVATLAKVDLEKYFEFLVTEESTERNKPDPDPYHFACDKLQLAPVECAVFEDSATGLKAAQDFNPGALIAARWY